MAIIDPTERSKVSAPTGENSRWHAVWQLILSAEARPESERRDFVLSAGEDAFVMRQAIAIRMEAPAWRAAPRRHPPRWFPPPLALRLSPE